MKIARFGRLTIAAGALSAALLTPAFAQETLENDTDRLSYMLGMNIGNSIKEFGDAIDVDKLALAIRHVLNNETPLLTPEQAQEVQKAFMEKARAKQAEQSQVASADNLKAGEAFLAENAGKEGIMTTDSGLQYQVLQAAEGDKPKATDTVTVHYRGTLLDGTEFDSSYGRGEPTTFALNRVIPGWTEGVQLMPVGSKYKFFIPAQLAYGERGAGQSIGPNSALIFEVELIDIK